MAKIPVGFSLSYPFLSIARHYDVDYGSVLCYADYMTSCKPNRDLTFWELEAYDQSSQWPVEMIELINHEIERQRLVKLGRIRHDQL